METGKKFGRLTFLGEIDKGNKWKSLFKCECGTMKQIRFHHVKSGKIQSCGCLLREICASPKKHGFSRTPTYNTWCGMIGRCRNPKNQKFYRYGARGIIVCERWKKFENFLEDMGERPGRNHSIDRINNDGNYEPGNCRWAKSKTQRANSSGKVWALNVDGITESLQFHCDRLGVDPMRVKFHLKKGRSMQEIADKLKKHGKISFR